MAALQEFIFFFSYAFEKTRNEHKNVFVVLMNFKIF